MINLISFVTKTYAVIVINLLLIDCEAIRNQGIANLVVCIKEDIYLKVILWFLPDLQPSEPSDLVILN